MKNIENQLFNIKKKHVSWDRAIAIGTYAATINFDWDTSRAIANKIEEEVGEWIEEIDHDNDINKINEEMGDILFTLAQWFRKTGLSIDEVLNQACDKFDSRLIQCEKYTAHIQGLPSTKEWEDAWTKVKITERKLSTGS